MKMFYTILRYMPKPIRRKVGRLISNLERADAIDVVGPYCPVCGDGLEWNGYEKTLRCGSVKEFVAYRLKDGTHLP